MNFSKWWRCNGGCQRRKGQIRMNNIYTKIAGMASGNVIWQIQNSGLRLQLFFYLFLHKKIWEKKVKLLFLIVVLFEQQWIWRLLMHLVVCKICLCYSMNLFIINQIIHNSFWVSIISNNLLILTHCKHWCLLMCEFFDNCVFRWG
jgi:hypothetical protein